jgi:hypothetical protein
MSGIIAGLVGILLFGGLGFGLVYGELTDPDTSRIGDPTNGKSNALTVLIGASIGLIGVFFGMIHIISGIKSL